MDNCWNDIILPKFFIKWNKNETEKTQAPTNLYVFEIEILLSICHFEEEPSKCSRR